MLLTAGACGLLSLGAVACGDDSESGGDSASGLSGNIQVDGSSTVAPLTEAAAELFQEENPDVQVSVGTSGTGGGFEKFCAGETDISDASRQIEAEEEKLCADGGVEYEEVQVANDALTVVVNTENPVTCMTTEQLEQIWGPDSTVSSWSDIDDLDAEYDEELQLFGPGTDSGTFDYFTEAINGEEGVQRKDYNNVGEDDNATVTGVSGSPGGMGYFGFSFFEENADSLKALEIDGGDGCVAPSAETVQDGSYTPLGRGLYIYPSSEALKDEVVQEFVKFYVENQEQITEAAGFIPMTEEQTTESTDEVEALASGGSGS
ncbi:PstS family phosphate ABC transporter substrate-binding protein [Thermoleophilia bacterium SCSIO 60948]|nr:PstS family phosphate ABC transporter substrate-binding protein [Thermoleophilia bacterium SCSIO 60948]